MTRREFSADHLMLRISDCNNMSFTFESGGIVDIATDDPSTAERVLSDVISSINTHTLASDGVRLDEVPELTVRLEEEIAGEIKSRYGIDCAVKFDYMLPDESSQKMIDDMERMKKMSDPAYAAAELERAMKQAQETALKNGMTMQDIQNLQNAPLPEFKPLPDTDDPLERAKAITAQVEQMKQMAMNGSLGAPAAAAVPAVNVQPPQSRPNFCYNCGKKLPESGNFCPNCGTKI
ncbi:MAG: zinc ribbon domain-containing protein [Ruminiclostridium sp.]|nr:zinc ribbon domain-containing protein [Ruminiclostridium sp.]